MEGEVEERVLVVLALEDLGHGLGRQVLGCFDHLASASLVGLVVEEVGGGCFVVGL